MQRDNYNDTTLNSEINSYSDLVNFIQKLNKDWILASRRLSPQILIKLLEYSENELYEYFKTLNLDDNI